MKIAFAITLSLMLGLLVGIFLRPSPVNAQRAGTIYVQHVIGDASAQISGSQVVGFSCVTDPGTSGAPDCYFASVR